MSTVKIGTIKLNPQNPRLIKDDKFLKLVASLKSFPEMATVRPIVVNKDMVVLGGNMRLRAMKEAGWKDAPVTVVDWPEEKQREFIVKDNLNFGDWDWNILANEWNTKELTEWGLERVFFEPFNDPSIDTSEITDDEITKKARELADQFIKERNAMDITCPKCGNEFTVA